MAIITGNGGKNTLTGTADADTISGLGNDDTISGLGGDDLIDGGTGEDSMSGGTGNDTYIVDDAGDVVTENADEGIDLVQSSITYTLPANVENLTLTGTANINGTGNGLDNIITGNSGTNTLDGGAGDDTLVGGSGADTLIGGEGNDSLDGGTGADTMAGGDGNDTYYVNEVTDLVTELPNSGTDIVFSTLSYTLTDNVENLTLTGIAGTIGDGNALDNIITGNSGNNRLNGLDGNDTVSGGDGNDVLAGNDGNDTVSGGAGDDRIGGQAGNDVLDGGDGFDILDYTSATAGVTVELALSGAQNTGGAGTDTISGFESVYGSAFDDVLAGGAGDDELVAFGGDDTLLGNAGNDRMYGGLGNDTYIVDSVGDITSDAGGIDRIFSTVSLSLANRWTIENLTLAGSAVSGFGNAADNVITGNALANTLSGADGNDTLIGGGGADRLYGGAGADIFRYLGLADSTADFAGRDAIYDFVEGEDTIDLAAIDADSGTPADDAFTFIGTAPFTAAGQVRFEAGASGIVVYANVDGDLAADFSIRLAGVSSVTAAAFNL